MAEDKSTVTGGSFGDDHIDDEIIADEILSSKSENMENDLEPAAYGLMFSEYQIREIIQGIEYEIMELEAKRSKIDAKTSAAAKLTAEIEVLLRDRDILQKNMDEFLMELADQQREDEEKMICKKSKNDSAGTSGPSEFLEEQGKCMFNLNTDSSSSEDEMEIQKRNSDKKKFRADEGVVERMYKRIEAAFNNSDYDDDDEEEEASEDIDIGKYTNIEGLAEKVQQWVLEDAEELKKSKVKK